MPIPHLTFAEVHAEERKALGVNDDARLAALCLSGGGIRSATFALGVIQALAKHGLLDKFHYLSTVSGGGYTGGWLTAWLHRSSAFGHVVEGLKNPTAEGPVNWLRRYSNYLSPNLGLFSADTWTVIFTYLRNLILNWFTVVPMLVLAVLAPRFAVAGLSLPVGRLPWLPYVYVALGFLCAIWGTSHMPEYMRQRRSGDILAGEAGIVKFHIIPIVAAVTFFNSAWFFLYKPLRLGTTRGLLLAMAFGVVTHLTGWAWGFIRSGRAPDEGLASWTSIVIAGVAGGALAWIAGSFLLPPNPDHLDTYATFAMPLLMAMILLAGVVFVGVASGFPFAGGTGGSLDDADREWWARSGAWLLISAVGWLALSGISLYGPVFLLDSPKSTAAAWSGTLSGIVSVWIGWSSMTGGRGRISISLSQLGEKVLAPAFAATLIVVLSLCVTAIGLGHWPVDGEEHHYHLQHIRLINGARQVFQGWPPVGRQLSYVADLWLAALAALCIASMYLSSRLFSANRFSIHYLYRNRLIRAYLGASNDRRDKDLDVFTGFAGNDNINLCDLRGQRPIQILNLALNITKGHRLAWQTRKAASFTASPFGIGTWLVDSHTGRELGYRLPEHYTDGGLSLGTAVAISGAAASPNMGSHTSTVLSFLLTFFNLRLGAWLPNPATADESVLPRNGPSSPRIFLRELLGMTDERSDWVYLSDGGHFENLGLYEMIKRRCRIIVLCDAAADPLYTFEDLANAIRKIRVDQDVAIDFIGSREADRTKRKTQHVSLLKITYPGGSEGRIIYLKPAVSPAMSVDIQSYAESVEGFPQESTGDQFFDEGQFEAYRRLGEETLNVALAEVRTAFQQPAQAMPT